MSDVWRLVGGSPAPEGIRPPSLDDLLRQVSRGDEAAFERLYDQLAAPVFGLVRRVVRDRAQAEENTQEVMVEVWRTASRFDPARGSALSWVLTMAHRRAVDRVRSAQASTGREERAARMSEDVAYALHALPEHEERRFEEHMARCEACLLEVRGLREAAARLGLAAAEPPPPALRSRVLARIAEVRQEPPVGEPGRAARTGPDAGGTVADVGRFRRSSGRRVPRVSWGTRISAAVATISTAAAVALGYLTWDAHRQLGQVTAHSQAVAAILAAPDARTVVRPVSGGGSATIVRSKSAGRLVFTASGLANLPASRAYELWLMGPDGPRPAGLLQRAADGTVLPLVALTLAGEEQIGLTVEPAGGSARPTTQPILLARLPGG